MSESDEISTSARQTGERKKSNLAFAFFCLDKSRARDMEVFYAFCRLMDDIADEEGRAPAEKRRELEAWKAEIASLYGGSKELSPLAAEMADVVARRKIPQEYIQAIIDGVMRDTSGEPFETFEDIRKYCYGVASAVGLATIYIFGFKNERTKLYAESLGYALQFTNILRDAAFDMRTQNRCYIPRRELEFFGVSEGDLAEPSRNPRCKELFRMMHFRAKHFFRKADRLLPSEDRASMKPAFIMREIYENILDSIAASGFEISANPRKPGKLKKAALAVRALIRARGGRGSHQIHTRKNERRRRDLHPGKTVLPQPYRHHRRHKRLYVIVHRHGGRPHALYRHGYKHVRQESRARNHVRQHRRPLEAESPLERARRAQNRRSDGQQHQGGEEKHPLHERHRRMAGSQRLRHRKIHGRRKSAKQNQQIA